MNATPSIGIYGLGTTGAFGCGWQDMQQALKQAAQNGILPLRTPLRAQPAQSVQSAQSIGPVGPEAIPAEQTLLSLVPDCSALNNYFPPAKLRRISHFARLALLASSTCLETARPQAGEDCALLLATGYGATQATFHFLDSSQEHSPSPTVFSNSVHNTALTALSVLHGIRGRCCTVSQFELSFINALLTARSWLQADSVSSVLLLAVDEYCEVAWNSRLRFFGQPAHPANPFNGAVYSAIPGEGAVCFLLEKCCDHTEPPPFGVLDTVLPVHGKNAEKMLPHKETAFPVLGLDGHPECFIYYRPWLEPGHPQPSAYTHLYGSMPVAQALDMAAACCMLRAGELFPLPDPQQKNKHNTPVLTSDGIRCIKYGTQGELACIDISL